MRQWDTRGGIGRLLGLALHTCGNAVRRKVVDIDNDRREVQFLTVLEMRFRGLGQHHHFVTGDRDVCASSRDGLAPEYAMAAMIL